MHWRGLPRAIAWIASAEQRRGSERRRTPTRAALRVCSRVSGGSASCLAAPRAAPRARSSGSRASLPSAQHQQRRRCAAGRRARRAGPPRLSSSSSDVVDGDQQRWRCADARAAAREALPAALPGRVRSSATRARRGRTGAVSRCCRLHARPGRQLESVGKNAARARAARHGDVGQRLEQLIEQLRARSHRCAACLAARAQHACAPSVLASSTQASSMRERPTPGAPAMQQQAAAAAIERARDHALAHAVSASSRPTSVGVDRYACETLLGLARVEPGDRRQPLHDLEGGARPQRGLDAQQRQHQGVERGRDVGHDARRRRRLLRPGRSAGRANSRAGTASAPVSAKYSVAPSENRSARPSSARTHARPRARRTAGVPTICAPRAHRRHRAEVDQLGASVARAAHVARADVAVHEPARVEQRERRAHVESSSAHASRHGSGARSRRSPPSSSSIV